VISNEAQVRNPGAIGGCGMGDDAVRGPPNHTEAMREDLCIVYGKMVLYSTITLVYIKKSKIIRREEKLRSLGLVLLFSWIFHQQKKNTKPKRSGLFR
jgi:hypothetical protein